MQGLNDRDDISKSPTSQDNDDDENENADSPPATTHAALEEAIDERKHTLQEILEANQFMKQQIDLFAAFLWRHQQIREKNGTSQPQSTSNLATQNQNDQENDNDNENDQTANNSGANKVGIINNALELTIDEYSNLEKQLPVDVRLKMGITEKFLIKQEIAKLINKSEKDVSTLRAVLEECRARMAETKKDAYDFKRDIVVSAQTSSKAHSGKENHKMPSVNVAENTMSFANIKVGKINAEKVKRFINEKLKAKHLMYKKYQTKNQQLQNQISKLHDQLNITDGGDGGGVHSSETNGADGASNSGPGGGSASGDSYHTIDLEQLKIQNAQYNATIIERNKELLKLKMNTGKTVQLLNNLKQRLNNEMTKQDNLTNNISDRQLLIDKLKAELEDVSNELNKQNKLYLTTKQKLANADLPQVIDYVNQKATQYELESTLKNWQRKVQIATLSAKQTKVIVKHQ